MIEVLEVRSSSSGEHLRGEEYRVVSACLYRRGSDEDRVAGRAAGVGSGSVPSPETVAQAPGPARPGQDRHRPRVALAVGGDCLADVPVLRAEPSVFGAVTSDPTVSRQADTLAADADQALTAIDSARAAARARVWAAAGKFAPDHETGAANPVVVDVDATLVTAHSDKELAAPTFKRGFGFHPLLTFADHTAMSASLATDTARAGQVSRFRSCSERERRLQHRRRPHHRAESGLRAAPRPRALGKVITPAAKQGSSSLRQGLWIVGVRADANQRCGRRSRARWRPWTR